MPPQPGTPSARASGAPRDTDDPIARWLAAYAAHIEGQEDVSAVLLEPLVKDLSRATGPALAIQADFVERDPIFPEGDSRDLARDLRARAAEKDPELWEPRFMLAIEEAEKVGLPEVTRKVEALAARFREVPDLMKALAGIYARLGWEVEQQRTVREAAKRFPDDLEVLRALLRMHEDEGELAQADAIAAHIKKLDPDAELDLERALKRRDWGAAIAELKRLGDLRKDRKDIALRIADLLTRAGRKAESLEQLERAVAKEPSDGGARLALADARFARGERDALQKALVEAIRTGADSDGLRDDVIIALSDGGFLQLGSTWTTVTRITVKACIGGSGGTCSDEREWSGSVISAGDVPYPASTCLGGRGGWRSGRPRRGGRGGGPRAGPGSGPGFRGRNGEWGKVRGRKVVPRARDV